MKTSSLAILLFVFCITADGQNYTFVKQWDKRYGGTGEEGCEVLLNTTDGGFLIGGYSLSGISGDKTETNRNSALTSEDYWVVKLDANGNKLWDKRFGTSSSDYLKTAICTADGGYLLGGSTNGGTGGDKTQPSQGSADYWIVKIDAQGNKQWDKRYGGSGADGFYCMQQTKDGGYILGGASSSGISGDKTQDNWDLSHFYADIWIVKVDSAGLKQWDKRYGGTDDDYVLDIKQTKDGGYVLAGMSYSRIGGDKTQDNWDTLNPLSPDGWVVKIDSIGHKEWDKRLGTIGFDGVYNILQVSNDGYFLAALSWYNGVNGDKTASSWNNWFLKMDSSGGVTWQKCYYTGTGDPYMVRTKDDGYLIAGDAGKSNTLLIPPQLDRGEDCLGESNLLIMKLDSNGLKQWDKIIFTIGNDSDRYAVETDDGCYVVANTSKAGIGGYKTQAAWDSSYDFFVVKFCMEPYNGILPLEAGESFGLSVYPNPFATDIAISVQKENLSEATFTISNSLGQIIYQREENNLSQGYTKMLDLRYLPKGLYFITVEADGERVVRRVVKD